MAELPVGMRKQPALKPRTYSYSTSLIPGLVLLLDAAIILAVSVVTCDYFVVLRDSDRDMYIFVSLFVTLGSLVLFQWGGLYELDAIMRPMRFSDTVIFGICTAFLFLLSVLIALDRIDTFSKLWLLFFAGFAILGAGVGRFGAFMLLRRLGESGRFGQNLVVLGTGEQAQRFLERIDQVRPYFTSVVGVYNSGAEEVADNKQEIGGHPVIGDASRLLADVRAGLVDDVVIARPWAADLELSNTVDQLKELPVNVFLASDLVGFRLRFRPVLGSMSQLSMFEVERKPISGWSSVLKAMEDYVLGSIILLLLSPFLILVAIAIKIDSPGPVFFMQKRLGFNNRVFEIYKFRSMYHREVPEERVKQATKGDPRITRVGRFIRATSIDELPQLLNVLNGTMSLVGPRPHALSHNEEYGEQIRGYFARHKVKPGITGWAQVNGLRGETEALEKMEARVEHDIYYANNWSLLFDIRIIIGTALVLFFQKSAY